ncbi:MAG: sodium:solute symporter [Salibacteraceae bacterium]
MNIYDWIVLLFTLGFIVTYGTWRTRKQKDLESYLRGGREAGWGTVGLSVMATQASAITFLSTPGQAFESGMGFLQFYLGLPLALILVSAIAVPLFYKLNVYTAYEFLENRFDLKTRLFTAFLFLLQRGLAAGITIYAPSIVLSSVLGWDLNTLNIIIGVLVIIYTVSGGTRAVSVTQKWQMGVILAGMVFAFYILVQYITQDITFTEAVKFAGANNKMEIIDFDFDFSSRYTIWSGLTGGLFLSLSYFGTDQSQVQRYLSASSVQESRRGLMFNAILKIPMQFFILFTGVMLFVFYQMNSTPVNFNGQAVEKIVMADQEGIAQKLVAKYNDLDAQKMELLKDPSITINDDKAIKLLAEIEQTRTAFEERASTVAPDIETNDADYVFIRFILDYLPHGAIGLLLAVILSAGMSSTAGELNALSTTSMNDYFKRLRPSITRSEKMEVRISRLLTVGWGIIAITVALSARLFDNLIELVNLLGSLFYGTILGIFICAIFLKWLRGSSVFWAGILSEAMVLLLYAFFSEEIGYLMFNAIGCAGVLILSTIGNGLLPRSVR